MKPYVVDANVMNGFQKERIEGTHKVATCAIHSIINQNYIVIDDDGPCMQEWTACAAGAGSIALNDWIADMMIQQKLRLASLCADSKHKELTALGIPKKDHKWVRLALGSGSGTIVTDDIDLFDRRKREHLRGRY